MNTLKLIAIGFTAAALTASAFAGPDYTQLAAQKRAFERLNAPKAVAGATRPQAVASPTRVPALGHPTERVRR